ncbi:MAG: LemA domain-containing protein [Chloroflexi bacterium]|mgnify:FL=1|nr:LemA domain-containing protein [Chloroflexota bacterium]MBT7080070.1 LemA domain-containing protein [Chloroflexota bacterium]MBT7289767.1 LemA domain-containing protein [Chloroflexota bacterium]
MLPIIIGSVVALVCLVAGFWVMRRKRLIDDLPTSKTQGVFIGLVELKGTAECEKPLSSYLAGEHCVQYAWHVEEHWSRVVHETYTDSKGNTRTRTRRESGWKRVAGDEVATPFYLKDDTGVIHVVPDGANIHNTKTFDQTCTPGDGLYYRKGPAYAVANSSHRRRFREDAIPLHASLYIMGQARERQDVVAAEITRDKNAPMFLISMRSEKQLSTYYARWCWFWMILGLVAAVAGAVVWGMLQPVSGVRWQPIVSMTGGFALVLALGWVWTVYNSLVDLNNRLQQGWSQVDVQLKRRYDLIPNLVNAVQGYRDHESQTLQLVTELRSQQEATRPGDVGPDFRGVAPVLQATIERYPELKANESFLKLQSSLIDTEQRIALARDYYNNIAMFHNTRLEIIPDRFVASLARLRQHALIGAADFERAPVEVKLVS